MSLFTSKSMLFVLTLLSGLVLSGCQTANMDIDVHDSYTKLKRISASEEKVEYKVAETYADLSVDANGEVQTERKKENPKKMYYTFYPISERAVKIHVDIEDQYGYRLNYTSEAEFVKGSWSEFVNDRPVEISLTAESEKKEEKISADYLRRSLEREINREYAGRVSVTVDLLTFDFKSSNLTGANGSLMTQAKGSLSMRLNIHQ
ncbi:MAG: hypothetical protein KDD61_16445 [Bdellovibrionales bacterium]|nr:hypothetical protein [Bdellovibrionales bacterium]